MTHERIHNDKSGLVALQVLIFSAVSIIMMTGFILWAETNIKLVFNDADAATALLAAEAGIEYYRWHLAHDPGDFRDGTGQPGPYVHNYYDKDGALVGTFTLDITAPSSGSTVTTIRSTGSLAINPAVTKIIETTMQIPGFNKYAAVTGNHIRFGEGTELYGPVHSNGGIRMDGVAYNLVTSALAEYNDPDHSGGNEFGVHTHVAPQDPTPPAAVPDRTDVFVAGREFPVASIDFFGITQDLATIKASAQADGLYFDDSGDDGYHMVLKTDDSFDLYRVTKVVKPPNGCVSVLGQQDWGTWTIQNETFLANYSFPSNGLIFTEDHLWIEGQIDTAILTIAAARFPENPANWRHIVLNNDLLYTNYDGSDIIGLIAQGNITVGWDSEDDLRIDGALIAKNDRVGRYYYRPPSGNKSRCAPHHIKQIITLYGMIASNQRYGFAYSNGTGYQDRIIIYDANLLLMPPPNFPLTGNFYTPILWNEVK